MNMHMTDRRRKRKQRKRRQRKRGRRRVIARYVGREQTRSILDWSLIK
jgi:hypothetical protein